jgi:S1-C subfamily serine protease
LGLIVVLLAVGTGRASGLDLEQVVRQIEHSVVRVETDTGLGSGVVVDDAGLVLTNFHVIDDARTATIELRSNQTLEVTGFLAVDPRHDLALLKSKPMPKPVAMRLAKALPGIGAR